MRAPRFLSLGLLALSACGQAPTRVDPPRTVPSVSTPIPAASSAEPIAEVPAPVERRPPFDLTSVVSVLDGDGFAPVKALVADRKWLDAAKVTETMAAPARSPEKDAALAYLTGLFRLRGGDPKGAVRFFKAASNNLILRPFALARAAAIELSIGEAKEAVTLTEGIDEKRLPPVVRSTLRGRALLHAGKVDEAALAFDGALAKHPKGWPAIALELARGLLEHPSQDHAKHAADLALEVLLDGPLNQDAAAQKIFDEAHGNLSRSARAEIDQPALAERVERGRRMLASSHEKKALALSEHLVKDAKGECGPLEVRARALFAVGRASEASDFFEQAITACGQLKETGLDGARLLFTAGRAAAKGGRPALAMKRFARVEGEFSDSSLADDARLAAARVALGNSDLEAFSRLLGSIARDYPTGDSSRDGLFLLAFEAMKKGDWESARAPLEEGAALPKERAYYRAGRFPYFLGRALVEQGKKSEGQAALTRVLSEYPLSYYSALAYARLEAVSPGSGDKALRELRVAGPPPEGPTAEVQASDPFKSAILLAELGDEEEAQVAFDVFGVNARTSTPEMMLVAAEVLGKVGDGVSSHSLLRSASEIEPRKGRSEAYQYRDAYPLGPWRDAWEAAYPRPFHPEVEKAATENGIPESLVYGIAREESAFQKDVISKAGALGLMQVMPAVGRAMATRLQLKTDEAHLRDPEENTRLGARFLAAMRSDFPGDTVLAIPAYNAGVGRPREWVRDRPRMAFDLFVEDIPFEETRNYTKRVIGSILAYEELYAPDGRRESLTIPLLVSDGG